MPETDEWAKQLMHAWAKKYQNLSSLNFSSCDSSPFGTSSSFLYQCTSTPLWAFSLQLWYRLEGVCGFAVIRRTVPGWPPPGGWWGHWEWTLPLMGEHLYWICTAVLCNWKTFQALDKVKNRHKSAIIIYRSYRALNCQDTELDHFVMTEQRWMHCNVTPAQSIPASYAVLAYRVTGVGCYSQSKLSNCSWNWTEVLNVWQHSASSGGYSLWACLWWECPSLDPAPPADSFLVPQHSSSQQASTLPAAWER